MLINRYWAFFISKYSKTISLYHTYIYIYVCIYTHTYTHIYICGYTHIHIYTFMYVFTKIHTPTHTHPRTHTHIYIWNFDIKRKKLIMLLYICFFVGELNRGWPECSIFNSYSTEMQGKCFSFSWIAPLYPWSVPWYIYIYIYIYMRVSCHPQTDWFIVS